MSIEIGDARTRWQNTRQALLRADFNHADEELARAIHFADHHPIIGGLLKKLRENDSYKSLEVADWIKEHNDRNIINLNFSLDDEERCAQSLKMIDWMNSQFETGSSGLRTIGQITYIGSSSKFIEYIHSAIENLFDPLYFYIDTELRNLDTLITPAEIIKEIQSLVDNEVSIHFPETHKLLTDAYKQLFELATDSSGTSWYQVGYSCRAVLVKFAYEVFNPIYVPEGQEQPKADDAGNKLKWTSRHLIKSLGYGDRYKESIEKIIQANWDFVSNLGHMQQSASEKDARLALIYTYLTIEILDRLLHSTAT